MRWDALRRRLSVWPLDRIVLTAGALHQIVWRLFTFLPDYDNTFLLTAGMSLFKGHRTGLAQAAVTDLSHTVLAVITHWPPGYSFLSFLFVKFAGSPYRGMVLSDLAGIALFYGALGALLRRLSDVFPPSSRVVVAATVGFLAPSYLDFFTNVWSLAFFLCAVLLLLPGKLDEKPAAAACASAGVLLGLTVALRWAYGPASFMPLLVLAATDWKTPRGRRRLFAAALGWAAIVGLLIGWKAIVGTSGISHLRLDTRWFPENLIRFHPFGADAIFGTRWSELYPSSAFDMKPGVNMKLFVVRHLYSLLLIAAAVCGAQDVIRRAPSHAARARLKRFFAFGASASAATIALLVTLALRHQPDPALGGWVYVESPRYFNIALPFIVFGVAPLVVGAPKRWFSGALSAVALIGFVASATVWTLGVPQEVHRLRQGWNRGPLENNFYDRGELVRLLRSSESPDKPNVLVEFGAGHFTVRYRGMMADYAGWSACIGRPPVSLGTSRPVNVVALVDPVMMGPDYVGAFERFCRDHGGRPLSYSKMRACRASLSP